MKATEVRPGSAITMDGKLLIVIKTEHTKPGKGPAYIQIKARDVVNGGHIEKRLGSFESVEEVNLDRRSMEYLYSDGSGATFMDSETYDQIVMPEAILGEALLYLKPNTNALVLTYEEKPLSLELPASVELTVTDTTPAIKGATATNQMKDATCETGLKIKVPPFISIGELVKISTLDGSYLSRA